MSHKHAGEMLCKPVKSSKREQGERPRKTSGSQQGEKRLHSLADATNTLIPIESFEGEQKSLSSSPNTLSKVGENSSKLQSQQHIKRNENDTWKSTVKQRNSEQSDSNDRQPTNYKTNKRYEKELMTALFMYMCCSLKP